MPRSLNHRNSSRVLTICFQRSYTISASFPSLETTRLTMIAISPASSTKERSSPSSSNSTRGAWMSSSISSPSLCCWNSDSYLTYLPVANSVVCPRSPEPSHEFKQSAAVNRNSMSTPTKQPIEQPSNGIFATPCRSLLKTAGPARRVELSAMKEVPAFNYSKALDHYTMFDK